MGELVRTIADSYGMLFDDGVNFRPDLLDTLLLSHDYSKQGSTSVYTQRRKKFRNYNLVVLGDVTNKDIVPARQTLALFSHLRLSAEHVDSFVSDYGALQDRYAQWRLAAQETQAFDSAKYERAVFAAVAVSGLFLGGGEGVIAAYFGKVSGRNIARHRVATLDRRVAEIRDTCIKSHLALSEKYFERVSFDLKALERALS